MVNYLKKSLHYYPMCANKCGSLNKNNDFFILSKTLHYHQTKPLCGVLETGLNHSCFKLNEN